MCCFRHQSEISVVALDARLSSWIGRVFLPVDLVDIEAPEASVPFLVLYGKLSPSKYTTPCTLSEHQSRQIHSTLRHREERLELKRNSRAHLHV
jgi:hypothetical protein